MACIQNPSSRENDAYNMEEFISALRDIQSMDFDKLRADFLQSQSEGGSRCGRREYEEMKVRCDKIESERNHFKAEFEKLSTNKVSMENEFARIKDSLMKTEQDSLEKTREIFRLQGLVNSMENELRIVKEQLQNYQYQLQRKEEKQQTQTDATMRTEALSCQRKQQMPIGQSIIPDMSDQNGLAKLGKRYSELYDNEWPNAFDVLTAKFRTDDKSAIELLRSILLECHKHAFDMSEKQMMKAEHVVSGSSKRVDPNCNRLLKEARRHVDIKQADDLHKKFLEVYLMKAISKTYLNEPSIQIFATECFQLCWLMSVQDPPAAFAQEPVQGDRFDTNIYKYYTMSGDEIDMVVWPALLHYENGPLLAKGIAQSYLRTRALSASTVEKPATKEDESSDTTRRSQYLKNGREATYGSDTTQYGHQVQGNAALLSMLDQDPMMTQTFSDREKYGTYSPMSNTPAEGYVFDATQFYQTQRRIDCERFQVFCQYIRTYDEPTLRNLFGPDFDRYNSYFWYGIPQNH